MSVISGSGSELQRARSALRTRRGAASVGPRPGPDSAAPISVRGRLGRLDLRNTWQVALGSVLVPLGIVIIMLAWYGSAHTPYVQQQIPYLVSGSFVGLGLMVVGGLLYWAHWLYRIYDQADLHQHQQAQRDRALQDLLERALVAAAALDPSCSPGPPGTTGTGATGSGTDGAGGEHALVVTASGTNFHRADCPIVARRLSEARRLSPEEAQGRPACRICQPLLRGDPGPQARSRGASGSSRARGAGPGV